MAMATAASTMTMPAVARTARSLTTGKGAGRPQTVRLSNLWPKLFQGDVSMCAVSGLGSEELARAIVDWAIVDSLRKGRPRVARPMTAHASVVSRRRPTGHLGGLGSPGPPERRGHRAARTTTRRARRDAMMRR